MNKTILKKITAAALAVIFAVPAISLVQNALLSNLADVSDQDSLVAFASGGAVADVVTNTATVSSPTQDNTPANDTAVANDLFCFAPDLNVTSFTDGKTTINASESNLYNGVIVNDGDSRVEAIRYTVELDTGEFYDASSIVFALSDGGATNTNVSTTTVGNITTYVYDITGIDLQPTQSIQVGIAGLVVRATAPDTNSYTATFDVTPTEPNFDDCAITDPDTTNNDASDVTSMTRVADLGLVKTSSGGADSSTSTDGRLNAGEDMNYTLTVTNNGPSEAAANLVVTDTWPSQITPVLPATPTPAGNYTESANWDCQYVAPTMTCTNTNPLANSGTSAIVINGTVNQTY